MQKFIQVEGAVGLVIKENLCFYLFLFVTFHNENIFIYYLFNQTKLTKIFCIRLIAKSYYHFIKTYT